MFSYTAAGANVVQAFLRLVAGKTNYSCDRDLVMDLTFGCKRYLYFFQVLLFGCDSVPFFFHFFLVKLSHPVFGGIAFHNTNGAAFLK